MNLDIYQRLLSETPFLFDGRDGPLRIITDPDLMKAWRESKRRECVENGDPVQWSELGVLLEDPYICVIRDLVEFPGGTRNGYIRIVENATLKGGQGVAILPFDRDTCRFILLKQFRHATRSWHLEIPRGFAEAGISPKEQAKVELHEETGISPDQIEELVDIGQLHANTGLEYSSVQLFFSEFEAPAGFQFAAAKEEGIERIVTMTLTELEEHIRDGTITDSFTIAAYTRSQLRRLI